MSEKEIRRVIEEICADLDRHARLLARSGVRKVVLPAVVGASLALGGCDRSVRALYGVPTPDGGKVKDTGARDGKVTPDKKMINDLAPVYMAPDSGVDAAEVDQGPQVDYMAPDKGPTPPYMAPDKGVVPPYMAPDKGAIPPYMAPDVGPDSSGPTPLYMSPQPSKDGGGKK